MNICLRFWIEKDGKHLMGKGGYEILKAIKEHGSISKASKELGMSYRFVWNYIRRIENVLGGKVVISKKGGVEGGETHLTDLGLRLIEMFERYERLFESVLDGVKGVVEAVNDSEVTVRVDGKFKKGDKVLIINLSG